MQNDGTQVLEERLRIHGLGGIRVRQHDGVVTLEGANHFLPWEHREVLLEAVDSLRVR